VAPPSIDLWELQRIAGQYADQHQMVVAAGPFAAATPLRTLVTRNKLASGAVVAGGAWLTIHMLSGSMLRLIQDQFGYLQSLLGG
jgi:hypothetical protein